MLLVVLLLIPIAIAAAEPLTLKEAVSMALQNSPEIRVALAQEDKAQQSYREARAQFIPNLVVGSGLAATSGFPLSIEGAAPSLVQLNSTAKVLNLPQRHAITESRQMQRAASAGAAARREEIAWKTAAAYLELNKVRRSLEYAHREVESAESIERTVEVRVKEGREIPLESSRARLATARRRQRVTELEGRAAVLAQMLRGLTGIPETQAMETIDNGVVKEAAPSLPTPASAEAALEHTLASSEGLKRLEWEVAAREARVRSERA